MKQYFIFQCVERCLYLCILYLYLSGLVDSLATLTLLLLFYFSHCCPTTFLQSTKNPLNVKTFWIARVAWCTVSPVFEVTKGTLGASSLEKEHTQEKENRTSGWTSPRPTLKKSLGKKHKRRWKDSFIFWGVDAGVFSGVHFFLFSCPSIYAHIYAHIA